MTKSQKGCIMTDVRLSFRLSPDSESAETWMMLKDRNRGKTDKSIFDELMRRERIRLDNKQTHSDMLAEIRRQVGGATNEELKALLLRILSILEKFHVQ
jgi:hypothetical protein